MVGFDDLPTEILFQIFQASPIDKLRGPLYHLSVLSKSLHERCLPLLLKYQGVELKGSETEVTWSSLENVPRYEERAHIDMITCLRVALFITRLKSLSICFRCEYALQQAARPDSPEALQSLLDTFYNVRALLTKLDHVDTITFAFDGIRTGAMMELCQFKGATVKTLFMSIEELVAHATTKTTNLTVWGEHSMGLYDSFKSKENKKFGALKLVKLHSVMPGLKGGGEFVRWKYAKVPEWVPKPLPTDGRVDTLSIRDMLFLIPPFLQWTLALLRQGWVTKLELNSIQLQLSGSTSDRQWTAILSSLADAAASFLTDLVVDGCNLQPAELSEFLCLLPNLKSLRVMQYPRDPSKANLCPYPSKSSSPGVVVQQPLKIPHLLHLTHITAPEPILTHLLHNQVFQQTIQRICLVSSWSLQKSDITILASLDHFARTSTIILPSGKEVHFDEPVRFSLALACKNNSQNVLSTSFPLPEGGFGALTDVRLTFICDYRAHEQWYSGHWLGVQGPVVKQWFKYFSNAEKMELDVCIEQGAGPLFMFPVEPDGPGKQLLQLAEEIRVQNGKEGKTKALVVNGKDVWGSDLKGAVDADI